MEKKFNECSVWEKTDIIDLPFLPFNQDKEVTSRMINESAKYIKKIKNVDFRGKNLEQNIQNERRFVFYQADTLIGLDISVLDVSSLTYLDQIYFLLKMYPLVMINSHIPEESIKKITLHSYCLKNNYILPIFSAIPFLDKALSGDCYGEELVELFKGEKEKVDLSNLCTNKDYSKEELAIRFPQLDFSGNEVTLIPQITWLGVNDEGIECLLNDLFNNNTEAFNCEELCIKHKIERSKLMSYINKSMLFCKMDEDNVIFRLQRKNVYWGFVCNLAAQFEKEMIERDAICYDVKVDESIGTIKKIDEKIYHKIGNLFLENDSYSYKVFSNIKRIVENNKYSKVLVVDNGNMSGLISMLKGSGLQEDVYEILDYYGTAVKFPMVDYQQLKNENVLIIIDIINTGKLLASVIEVLDEIQCRQMGVFSFIVDKSFLLRSFLKERNISLTYLTEKELNVIDDILEREYSKRFSDNRDLNFRLLWGATENDISVQRDKSAMSSYTNDEKPVKEYYEYEFGVNDNIDSHSYVYQKLKRLIEGNDMIIIYKGYKNLKKLINKINSKEFENKLSIEEIEFREIQMTKFNRIYKDQKVLFLLAKKYIRAHRAQIEKFVQVNKMKCVRFGDLVEYTICSLDNEQSNIQECNVEKYVFSSKLKRYISSVTNPQMDFLDNNGIAIEQN